MRFQTSFENDDILEDSTENANQYVNESRVNDSKIKSTKMTFKDGDSKVSSKELND